MYTKKPIDTEKDFLLESSKKLKIAIIGAGISGCASAFFLREAFDTNVEIVVFEKSNQVGGRLATFEFRNRKYELGGSIIHSQNYYMNKFVKICGLQKAGQSKPSDEYLALYDSNGILLELTGKYFGILDKIRFILYFGILQLYKFKKWIRNLTNSFEKIYKLQDNGYTFTNLEELLKKISPDLFKVSQMSLRSALKKEKFNYRIINHLASSLCLSNYSQSIDIDGFVGAVSVAGFGGSIWSVKNGNKQVPIKLLEKSGAKLLLNTQVSLVSKDNSDPNKNLIVYKIEGEEKPIHDNSFDYVIICFPIYRNILNKDIRIDFESSKQFMDLEMQLTNTYFVYGVAKVFPNLPKNKRIQLFSVDSSDSFRIMCVELPCDYSMKYDQNLYISDDRKLYKIFSDRDLIALNEFDRLFQTGYELVKFMPWLAYPKYNQNPSKKFAPDIILDSAERSRIYYSNSMEWSASCMEINVISARNIVNLITKKEGNFGKLKSYINYVT